MPIAKYDSNKNYNQALAAVNTRNGTGVVNNPKVENDGDLQGVFDVVNTRFLHGPQTSWEGNTTFPSGVA